MPHTIEISKAVGTIRNMIDCKRNVIPLEQHIINSNWSKVREKKKFYFVPRSMARVKPPVCLSKWNFISKLRRCSNVSLATLRIARWPMLAKMALRSSPERVAPILAAPSSDNSNDDLVQSWNGDVHPRISDPASNQTVEDAVISTLSESTMSLNICGTWTLSTCRKDVKKWLPRDETRKTFWER